MSGWHTRVTHDKCKKVRCCNVSNRYIAQATERPLKHIQIKSTHGSVLTKQQPKAIEDSLSRKDGSIRALVALPEDQGSIPNTVMAAHNNLQLKS